MATVGRRGRGMGQGGNARSQAQAPIAAVAADRPGAAPASPSPNDVVRCHHHRLAFATIQWWSRAPRAVENKQLKICGCASVSRRFVFGSPYRDVVLRMPRSLLADAGLNSDRRLRFNSRQPTMTSSAVTGCGGVNRAAAAEALMPPVIRSATSEDLCGRRVTVSGVGGRLRTWSPGSSWVTVPRLGKVDLMHILVCLDGRPAGATRSTARTCRRCEGDPRRFATASWLRVQGFNLLSRTTALSTTSNCRCLQRRSAQYAGGTNVDGLAGSGARQPPYHTRPLQSPAAARRDARRCYPRRSSSRNGRGNSHPHQHRGDGHIPRLNIELGITPS